MTLLLLSCHHCGRWDLHHRARRGLAGTGTVPPACVQGQVVAAAQQCSLPWPARPQQAAPVAGAEASLLSARARRTRLARRALAFGARCRKPRHHCWEHRHLSDFLAEYFMTYINGFLVFFITKLSTLWWVKLWLFRPLSQHALAPGACPPRPSARIFRGAPSPGTASRVCRGDQLTAGGGLRLGAGDSGG